MKHTLVTLFLFIGWVNLHGQNTLPMVYSGDVPNDVIAVNLRAKAEKSFNRFHVPEHQRDWFTTKESLKEQIIAKAKISFYPDLPLDYHETMIRELSGYTIKSIYFQTRPNVYATANLYIPDGEGPFPGVVVMMGHSQTAKLVEAYQSLGHTLAVNGYVAVTIDPWGSGERATTHGIFEYHGANRGASLINVGETLMGMQITDNMRAVDLLCSFPFVDSGNIGATGASGGGNQTMWLAAMDERVKAAVPVVSVGTFQSYVMNSNCVCEMLMDGLTFTEESSVLGLIAPRALKICNALQDSNPSFFPQEMLRSFQGAKTIYRHYAAESKLSYQLFDTPHGYYPEMREAMLGWFDLHLKNQGMGVPKEEQPFTLLPESDLMVFPSGERSPKVVSTEEFCFNQGSFFRSKMLANKNIKTGKKKKELRGLLRVTADTKLETVHSLPISGDWERHILTASSGEQIPVLTYLPNKSSTEYILICDSKGKKDIPEAKINDFIGKKYGICIVDLWGIGESASTEATRLDGSLPEFHTLSRSVLWLGTTMQGIWVNQLEIVLDWLKTTHKVQKITIEANKELAVAGLLLSALTRKGDDLILHDMPISYLFDKLGDIDYFSMAIHIPDFLKWGDISLLAVLCNKDITLNNPVSITGRTLSEEEIESFKDEFDLLAARLKSRSNIHFKSDPELQDM